MTTSYSSNYKPNLNPSNPPTTSTSGSATISYNTGKTYTPTYSYTPTLANPTLTAGANVTASSTTRNYTTGSYSSAKVDLKPITQGYTSPYTSTTRTSYTSKPTTTTDNTPTNPLVTGSISVQPTLNLSGVNRPPTQKLTITSPIGNTNDATNSSAPGSVSRRGHERSFSMGGTARENLRTSRISMASVFKTPEEEVKAVANQFFDQYDRRHVGTIDSNQLAQVMSDTYNFIGKPFFAKPQDLDSFFKILDTDNDGKITFEDIETLCQKYLFGIPIPDNSLRKTDSSTISRADPSVSGKFNSFTAGKYDPSKRIETRTVESTEPLSSKQFETLTSAKYDPAGRGENSTVENSQSSAGAKPLDRRGEAERRSGFSGVNEPPRKKTPEEEFAKEIFDATRIFEKFDTDKSGFLEDHEIPFVLQETYAKIGLRREIKPQDVKTYIQALDLNNDGKISLDEFIKVLVDNLVREKEKYKPVGTSYKVGGYQRPLYKTEIEKARELFTRFDTDKSGYLDLEEIPALLEETNRILNIKREITQEEVKNFLSTFDKNSDNKISFEEFTKLIQTPK